MRARSALLLALALAAPLVLAAGPEPSGGLEAHAAGSLLAAHLEGVLSRVGGQAALGPLLGAQPEGPGAAVRWLAGARASGLWVPSQGAGLDLDGDGSAELHLQAPQAPARALALAGLEPAREAWVAWREDGAARWGLAGMGLAPQAVAASLQGGELRVRVEGQAEAWHAAFAFAGKERRVVAWLSEPDGPAAFEAAVGEGFLVRVAAEGRGGLRVLLLDDELSQDVTLRGVPGGARLVRAWDGGLHYRAPARGGALAYEGDAGPAGQEGAMGLAAEPAPHALTLQPSGEGFVLDSSEPTDAVVDWRPPAGEGARVVGNDVDHLEVQPGNAGGIVVRGDEGRVAVLPGAQGASALPGGAHVVDLGSQGALASGARSALPAAAAAVVVGGAVGWAALGLGRKPSARSSSARRARGRGPAPPGG